MREFDLVVIGSGAGLSVSAGAAAEGWEVAVVEDSPFGGTCLNRGCIPSKLLIRSADVKELVDRAHLWGIDAEVRGIDWRAIVESVNRDVDEESAEIEAANQQAPNVTVFRGSARFTGEKTLAVGEETISAPYVVIAAGTRPRMPEIEGLAGTPFLTSDDAMRLERQPRRLGIIGGGAVASEMAHFFGTLGTSVSVFERRERLLMREDEDVSRGFTDACAERFDLHLETEVERAEYDGGEFRLELSDAAEITCDALLVAAGRVPNTDRLGVDASGVAVDADGFVQTDAFMETNVPGIFALGDVVGRYMLRHNANLEAAHVLNNLLNPNDRLEVDRHGMPHAVFASPQVGVVGATERELQTAGTPYLVGFAEYGDVAYGQALKDETGFVKVIVEPDSEELLGCHILGTDAAILVQEAANVVRHRLPYAAISSAIYIHPALPEVVQRAFGSLHKH